MTFYKITHLKQRSKKWKDWRKGVIGASDAPTIMGDNPWKHENELFEEKVGLIPEFSGNSKTEEGIKLEPKARKIIENLHGIKLKPVIAQDSKYPFLAASLDGIDRRHELLVEIKCGEYAYEVAKSKKDVPEYYYAQLQHMLMVTKLDQIHYYSYRPNKELLEFIIDRDKGYIKMLQKIEFDFVDRLNNHGHNMLNKFMGRKVN